MWRTIRTLAGVMFWAASAASAGEPGRTLATCAPPDPQETIRLNRLLDASNCAAREERIPISVNLVFDKDGRVQSAKVDNNLRSWFLHKTYECENEVAMTWALSLHGKSAALPCRGTVVMWYQRSAR